MEFQKKFVLGLSLVALFGTVTNYVFFSPVLTLLVPLAIYTFNKNRVQRPVAWLYVFLLLFMASTIFYHINSFIEFGFYRRDGNFIISYAPLLVLPLFSFEFKLDKYLRTFYIFALTLYGVLFIYHLLTTDIFSGGLAAVFGGLFYAQNAVGGFLAILCSLGFAYYYHRRGKREFLCFLLLFIILVATYSRGSILGFVLGVAAWYLTTKERFKTLFVMLLIPVMLTVGSVMIGYPFYKSSITASNVVETEIEEGVDTKGANILIRLYYSFPRAYHLFLQSPVLGTGVGSYNDRPFNFEEVVPKVRYNAQPNKVYSDAHAHHSYLHILAEQGIVGLVVFLTFWISIFLYLLNVQKKRLIRDFLLIAFFTITFASFTEHRITTPSMMLPFTIPLGLFLMYDEKIKIFKMVKQ